jgi:hypothetical protein
VKSFPPISHEYIVYHCLSRRTSCCESRLGFNRIMEDITYLFRLIMTLSVLTQSQVSNTKKDIDIDYSRCPKLFLKTDLHRLASSHRTQGRIPAMYVVRPCPVSHSTNADFVMVASLFADHRDTNKKARFQSRRDICSWLARAFNYSVSHCRQGARCPVLSEARYGFHVKGNTVRIQEILADLM